MILTIIFWVIFGAIVGFIASALTGEGDQVNGWMNVVVGIVGALIGGLVMNLLGGTGVNGFNLYSFLVAIAGSVILLVVYRAFSHRSV